MSDIRTSALGGIPFGNSSGRPLIPNTGQPYFNGEVGRLELFTTTGWQNIVQETPGIASITGVYNESAGSGTINISGTNFVSGAYASAIGTNGVEVNATSTTYNSIVQLTATFTGLSAAYEPYDIKVTNPSNLFGMIPDALYINQSPIWQTPAGSLGTVLERDLVAFQFAATDPEGGTLTYSSSNIPAGLSLSSSGILSGVAPNVDSNTTYNFNVTVTDGANTAVSRAFSLTVNYLSTIELLLIGGGGGGGGTISGHHEGAGGGGAGGLYYNATMPITGSHLVTVGNGGAGGTSAGTNGYTGENSVFGTKIALGGGAGGGQYANPSNNGINGGSGGGWCGHAGFGRSTNTGLQSSSETGGLGNAGGQATSGGAYGGGGGGGAGSAGNNNDGRSGGAGGSGAQYSITGTAQFYAAGGGGAAQSSASGGTGGSGIGGNGSYNSGSGGSSNTGSGGGGGGAGGGNGGSGGSGVVIFAVPGTHTAQDIPGTLTYTRDTTTRAGHTVYRFTAGSGTITL